MVKRNRQRRYTRRVPTADDWYPTAEDGTVEGSVILSAPQGGGYTLVRISFWGGDDFGLERDFLYGEDDEEQSERMFHRLKKELDGYGMVTQEGLYEKGFVRA